MDSRHSALGLQVIGVMKLASAVLLVAAGVGIFRLVGRDLGESVEQFVTRFHLDPDNRVIQLLTERIEVLNPHRLRLISAGSFFYAFLHLIEGTGLLLKKRWAEYFTVFMTGSLVPFELYELAQKLTVVRGIVLAVNLAIVAYVVSALVRDHRDRKVSEAGRTA